jgi:hypothetical protein
VCVAASCGPPTDGTGLVVGVTTELQPGADFDELSYELDVNGASRERRTLDVLPSMFPLELPLDDLAGGDEVVVKLTAKSVGAVMLERTASTRAVGGQRLLLRVPLDPACREPQAPTCAAPLTCIGGSCADAFVPPEKLEEYAQGWGNGGADACKGIGQPPVVEVGAGQADYLPTMDGDVAQVEAGPQGGYHVWIAIRVRGVRQSSSVTTVTGSIASLGYEIAPYAVVFTFEPSEGGACELFGLRFRLDDKDHPVSALLGQDLHVDVSVKDTDGTVGEGSRIVRLSDDIL